MARKRMVSPELLTSESVACLPISARYGFVGLWTYLDDEGRGKDNASLIRAHLWPLDDNYTVKKVEADLAAWVKAGLICRYRMSQGAFLHAPNWTRWQKISHKSEVKIPPCPAELQGADHDLIPESLRNPSGVFLDEVAKDFGAALRNVVEVNSDQRSSSGDDLIPLHSFGACPDPKNHVHHRTAATA